MIRLTRLNGSSFVLSAEQIEMLEETPDTVITTLQGKKFVVAETVNEVIDRVLGWKAKIQLQSRLPGP